mmetsp:Transcript_40188/g.99469  ORF Transcript_40188/g.99469 Transcript_40188/m.99469 type:complete len:239 (-) Transcript_40188:1771-2487(-)
MCQLLRFRVTPVEHVRRHDLPQHLGDASVHVPRLHPWHQVDLLPARLVPPQRCVVLQSIAAPVLVHRQPAQVRLGVARRPRLGDLLTRRQALPRVFGFQPEGPLGPQWIARRVLQQIHPHFDPVTALLHGQLVDAPPVQVRRLNVQPVQAVIAQRAGFCKEQGAAAQVRAQVVEVHVHGVRAPAEVDVVREVDFLLVPHLLRHLQLDEEVAPLTVKLTVLLLDSIQAGDELRYFSPRG